MFSSIKNIGLSGCLVLLLGVCGVSAPVDLPRSLLFGGTAQEFVIDRGLYQDQANIQILDDFYKSREVDDGFTNTIKEEIASYGLGYLQGRFRLGLGIGNTYAAISSGFCANKNNAATDFCVFWEQYGLLINLGMLSASSLDLLYAKLSKSYNELPKGSFEGTNKKFLEDELDLKGSIVGEGVNQAGNIPALLAKWDNLTIAEAKSLYSQLAKTEIQGSKVVRTQAEILQDIQQRGITNPYNFAHPIEDFTLTKDVFFVRAYNQNKTGRWLISIDDVDNFSSVDDFIKKTAFPVVDDYGNVLKPDKMVVVKVPSGTTIRKSVARPQDWGGQGHLPGGATQYEIINFNRKEMEGFFREMGSINEFIK